MSECIKKRRPSPHGDSLLSFQTYNINLLKRSLQLKRVVHRRTFNKPIEYLLIGNSARSTVKDAHGVISTRPIVPIERYYTIFLGSRTYLFDIISA